MTITNSKLEMMLPDNWICYHNISAVFFYILVSDQHHDEKKTADTDICMYLEIHVHDVYRYIELHFLHCNVVIIALVCTVSCCYSNTAVKTS